MGTSKTLGIIGLCIGWLLPIVGVVLGIIGLCIKKDKEVALNVISLVIGIIAWIFWIGILMS